MEKRLPLLFKIFTLLFALSVHGQNFIAVTKSNSGQIINLSNKQVLEIKLPSIPSSGYGWYATNLDQGVITQIGDREFLPSSNKSKVGQQGTQVIRFIGVSQGTYKLTLEYKRQWKKDNPAIDNYTITVVSGGKYAGNYTPPVKEKLKFKHVTTTPKGVPSKWDWRLQCTPIEDQGNCGDCWAYASVGTFECNIKIIDGITRDLSEEFVTDCYTGNGSQGCYGSNGNAHDCWLASYTGANPQGGGAVYEADDPTTCNSTGMTGTCSSSGYPHHETIDSYADVAGEDANGVPPDANMKAAIYYYGPIWVAIDASDWSDSYSGGIWTESSQMGQTDHAVDLVGWVDSSAVPGGGYWILRNSWGAGWGMNGYMYISYGSDLVGSLADYIVYKGGIHYNAPPVAGFTATPTYSCMLPATIKFTNTCYNAHTFLWNFGDGSTDTSANPTHTYTTSGTFDVKLKATNSFGSDSLTMPAFITIANTGGPVSASCTPSTISTYDDCGILNFTFNTINNTTAGATDGYKDYTCSNATTVTEGKLYHISITTPDVDAANVRVWLDLNNDGQFTGANELIFSSLDSLWHHSGIVMIPATTIHNSPLRLRVGSDNYSYNLPTACTNSEYGQYEDYSVTILQNTSPPQVDFIANPTTVNIGQTVNFTDLTQNLPTSWHWTFSGGIPATSTLQYPSVIYTALGTYDVKLVATNAYGADSLIKTGYIQVVNSYNMCTATSSSAANGLLYDSGGPNNNYGFNEDCGFVIDIPCALSITLSFSSFDLGYDYEDFLEVYDGSDANGTLLLTAYGLSIPSTVTAYSGEMYIHFVSMDYVTSPGFAAAWTSVIPSGTPPVADFSMNNANPPFNVPVQFTDLTTNYPTKWLWNFGDGGVAAIQNPTYTYTSSGTFTVTLIATNCFNYSDTVSKTLTVQDAPVISVFPDSFNVTLTGCNDSTSLPFTIFNSGLGQLDYNITGVAQSNLAEVLSLTYGVDSIYGTYQNTLAAINQYYTNYHLTEINTTSASVLQAALSGKQVLLISSQYNGDPTVFSGFASVLQSFVNNGGVVILCGTYTDGSACVFNTGLFSGTFIDYTGSGDVLNVINNTDSLTYQFPSTIPAQDYVMYLNITNANTTRLVKYSTYYDVVSYRTIGSGKAIYIGYDYYTYNNYAAKIISNAVRWGCNASSWLSISNNSGVVNVNDTATINVSFKASGLNSGTYTGSLIINSNDSLNPQITVPCTLTLVGKPVMSLSDTCFNFGSVMVNAVKKDTLLVHNTGCDTLKIANITVSTGGFSVNATSFSVLPGRTDTVIVSFKPTSVGNYNGYLSIFDNYRDTTICLHGVGLPAPSVSINPTSFNVNLTACHDSLTLPLTINNTGLGQLDFNITGYSQNNILEVLSLTCGIDSINLPSYSNTLAAINQYFSNYNLTETNTTSASVLQAALVGKQVLLISSQENGDPNVYTGFASVLQAYVNNGGIVILCGTYANSSACIFNTGLFSGIYIDYLTSGDVLDVINNTDSLTYQFPSSIPTDDYVFYMDITNANTTKLVQYDDYGYNYDVVTYRSIGTGKAIYIGYDYYTYDNYAAKIIAAAVRSGSSSNVNWINVANGSGTVNPGGTFIDDITFKSNNMSGGVYNATITINTNDPLNPQILLPCTLTVSNNVCSDFAFATSACSGIVSFTDKTINTPSSWVWNFGDGSNSGMQNPTHTYTATGTYIVTLKDCNGLGCDSVKQTVTVPNLNGPVNATCTPATTGNCCGMGILNVSFNTINNTTGDGSEGYQDYSCTHSTSVVMGQSYTLSVQTGSVEYENASAWIDFNNDGVFDNSEQVMNSQYSYYHTATIVIPNVALINTPLRMRVGSDYYNNPQPAPCTDVEYGQFEDYSVIILPNTLPPVAAFTAVVLDECQGVVHFINQTANAPTSVFWNFGDNTTSSYMDVYHTYSVAGTYTVTMIATNPYGSDTSTFVVSIHSLNPNIIATGSFYIGGTVSFHSSSQGVTSWLWDFGDGYTSALQYPTHIYSSTGTYTVSLTVTNGYGCKATVSKNITIGPNGLAVWDKNNALSLFPNPNKGSFTIDYSGNETENFTLAIENVSGQRIYFESIDNARDFTKEINLTGISKGVYFLKLYSREKEFTRKIVID